MEVRLTRREKMIQWIGLGLAIIGFMYNGFKDYQNGAIKVAPLTTQNQSVEYPKQEPIRYYQAAFNPNTGKIYFLYPDGQWYEQIPQIRTDQTQYSAPVGTSQGTQQPPVGQRNPQQYAQTTANPWLQ
jgi:hypothetical protein